MNYWMRINGIISSYTTHKIYSKFYSKLVDFGSHFLETNFLWFFLDLNISTLFRISICQWMLFFCTKSARAAFAAPATTNFFFLLSRLGNARNSFVHVAPLKRLQQASSKVVFAWALVKLWMVLSVVVSWIQMNIMHECETHYSLPISAP